MNNPETHCPRCDIRLDLISNGHKFATHLYPADDYMYCVMCKFRYYFTGVGYRCKYEITMIDGDLMLYMIGWWHDGSTHISIQRIGSEGGQYLTFDHWIQFDITVEQLKVYMTFS